MKALTPLLLLFSFNVYTQDWTFEYVDFGAKPSIDVTVGGTAHIAYMIEATQGIMNHAERIDSSWEITTVKEGYFYGPLDIALDSINQPVIALHDHTAQNQAVYSRKDGLWATIFTESSGHDGWDNSIVIDEYGNYHTSTIDPTLNGLAEYGFYDGNQWSVSQLDSTMGTNYKFSTCIRLDSQDEPHVSSYILNGGKLAHSYRENGIWITEIVDDIGNAGMFSSMAIINDVIYIAYLRIVNQNYEIVVAQKNGVDWTFEVIDILDQVVLGFTGARNIIDLATDKYKRLHIAYSDTKVMKYGLLEDSIWQVAEVIDVSMDTIELGQQLSMAIDTSDMVHISYYEKTQEAPVAGNIMYVYGMVDSFIPVDTMEEEIYHLIEGSIICQNEEGLEGVRLVVFQNDVQVFDTTSDLNGHYAFEVLDSSKVDVFFEKSYSDLNGVSAADMVLLRKNLLGQETLNPKQICAADMNQSNSLSTIDIVKILKILLAKDPLPPKWFLKNENLELVESITLESVLEDVILGDLIAIKQGDVNGSACD